MIISGMPYREIDLVLDNCIYGNYKFLYLSPERLTTDLLRMRLEKMNVSLFAIDEAHCISQWGYDFRPPYLKIAEARTLHPDAPVLALTATATPKVQNDIQEKLQFKKKNIFIKSFERKNLSYVVLYNEDKLQKALDVLNKVSGSSVIYVRNRKKTKEISGYLNKHKISADFYHAGLTTTIRHQKQDAWISGKVRVMVATNAFGMGIDKPDVRTVIHLDMPDSLEAYYQEAGRAGRDDQKAYAVLFYSITDKMEIERRFESSFPSVEQVRKVYHALGNFLQIPTGSGKGISYNFNMSDFCNHYKLEPLLTFNCLKITELDGYIALSDSINLPSRLHISISNLELYKFQVEQPQFDILIKTVLRSYSGVFDDFVKINEPDIAARMQIDLSEIIKKLNYLQKLNIVHYQPQKSQPQLVFTQERMSNEDVIISKEHLEDRKKRFAEKANAVLNYGQASHKCRSLMLLNYFGEKSEMRCGICDYCRSRNKLQLNEIEFSMLSEKVKVLTHEHPVHLTELISNLHTGNEDKALKAIQWMLDNEQLKYVNGNELLWSA